MRAATKQKRDERALQQRLILHYSRLADWLETRSWYRDDNVLNVVCSLIPHRPSRVLELCCGAGLLLEGLSKRFPTTEFIGVDISPKMVQRARQRLAGSANALVLEQDWIYDLASEWDHAFDVVIVKNALHVLENVAVKLKDLRRVSREWTTLIVVETVSPNVDANDFIKRLFQIIDTEHLKQAFFTDRTLAALLKEAGWLVAQNKPNYVRQHIDTEDWLAQKCLDAVVLERARTLLSDTRNARVRNAMDFGMYPGIVPARMLRLQYIARHVFMPTAHLGAESRDVESAQLQLL